MEKNKIWNWQLYWDALELYADSTCSICETTINWYEEGTDQSGRVINNGINNLEKENWSTVCMKCLKIQILKKTIGGL